MRHGRITLKITSFMVFVCTLLMIWAGTVQATTWYVRKSGNNGNSGTSPGDAFRSISKARSQVAPGERSGVDQQEVAVQLSGDRCQRAISNPLADFAHLGILLLRLGIDRADAAAGDDVVELVQAYQLPGAV